MRTQQNRRRLGTWLMVSAPLGILVFIGATAHALERNPDILPEYLGWVNPIAIAYAWGAFWFGLYFKATGLGASFFFYVASGGIVAIVLYRLILLSGILY